MGKSAQKVNLCTDCSPPSTGSSHTMLCKTQWSHLMPKGRRSTTLASNSHFLMVSETEISAGATEVPNSSAALRQLQGIFVLPLTHQYVFFPKIHHCNWKDYWFKPSAAKLTERSSDTSLILTTQERKAFLTTLEFMGFLQLQSPIISSYLEIMLKVLYL